LIRLWSPPLLLAQIALALIEFSGVQCGRKSALKGPREDWFRRKDLVLQEARVFLIISLVADESASFANESLSGVLIWESGVTRRMTYQRGSFISGGIDAEIYASRSRLRGSRQWEDFFAASQLYSVWNLASFGARPDRSMPRWHSLFGMAQGSRPRQIPRTDVLIARVFPLSLLFQTR
jgi:hypothetical protein